MNKEQQDKNWRELGSEGQKEVLERHKFISEKPKSPEREGYLQGLANVFGSHNLEPKPKIRTWEDVEGKREDEDAYCCVLENALSKSYFDDKLRNKLIATYKIAKLIDLGYGGMVSEEEWKKSSSYEREDAIWTIECEYKKNHEDPQFRVACGWEQVAFPAFHSKELAEEFMSYPENVELVKQYNMM